MEELVYLNGSLLPRSQARVSVYDNGLLYGYAIFETMRAYQGRVFRLGRHIARLKRGMEALRMNPALVEVDLEAACRETLEANGLSSARLRLTVTRGEVAGFPGRSGEGTPNIVITARDYRPLTEGVYEKGYRVGISSYTRYSHSPLAALKTTNYLVNVLARVEAEAAGFDEALLLNEDGYITEGSTANIFFVTGSSLVTPPVSAGLLPGVTREAICEMAASIGLRVAEANVKPGSLGGYEAAFLTNSVIEIMPLAGITAGTNEVSFSAGQSLIRRLREAYGQMVVRELGLR